MINSTEPVAELVHVTKMYEGPHGGTLALKDITFAAHPGEMILLLGPSGSGKTTFLTLLAGLQGPTSGEVLLFGKRMNDYSPKKLQSIRARRMGFIFRASECHAGQAVCRSHKGGSTDFSSRLSETFWNYFFG